MNTILTDDERRAMLGDAWAFTETAPARALYTAQQVMESIAKAEAAVLAKLAQQEPVAEIEVNAAPAGGVTATVWSVHLAPGTYSLHLHPAPQRADRQRVPDEPDWQHPKIQALIGADARNRICIDLVWRILEDPSREFTASDMEYWDKLHDKVQEVALAAAPEAPVQGIDKETQTMKFLALVDDLIERDPDKAERFIESALARNALRKRLMEKKAATEAPAQASAVDERAAFEAWVLSKGGAIMTRDGVYVSSMTELWWECWQARAALAQKGGAA